MRVYHPTCCSRMIKGTEFVSARLPLDLRSLNAKGHRICLCVFTTRLAAPEWWRAKISSMCIYPLSLLLLNDKGRRIRLSAFITQFAKSEWQRAQNSSMRVYHSTHYSWMIKGAESVSARLPPNLLFLNDKGRKIRLCAFTTQLVVLEW